MEARRSLRLEVRWYCWNKSTTFGPVELLRPCAVVLNFGTLANREYGVCAVSMLQLICQSFAPGNNVLDGATRIDHQDSQAGYNLRPQSFHEELTLHGATLITAVHLSKLRIFS